MSSPTPADPPDDPPCRPKSTLFCPECSFESPASGDWTRVTDGTTDELRCPVCGALVDSRPRRVRRAVEA